MGRYVCDCSDMCREEYDDSIEVEAKDAGEAEDKAVHLFCGDDYECIENTLCHCEIDYEGD